jgi:hypothetical protein
LQQLLSLDVFSPFARYGLLKRVCRLLLGRQEERLRLEAEAKKAKKGGKKKK